MVKTELKIISNRFVETVCSRLADNKQVRRTLPAWGRVHIDRQLPFLCLYRQPLQDENSLTETLIMGEASYLTASGKRSLHKQLAMLVNNIAGTLKEKFGSFLIVEIWAGGDANNHDELSPQQPAFKIFRPKNTALSATITTLEKSLKKIKVRKQPALVEMVTTTKIAPPGLPVLLSSKEIKLLGCHIIGIEVRPIYKSSETGELFPLVRRELKRGFAKALRSSFFRFTRDQTTHRPPHYHSLGRWSMVKAVWEVDRQLAEICNGFDFLLQVTPTNSHSAWSAFERSRYEHAPEFTYRPLPIDPVIAKRRLYKIPLERIEDPTLGHLFREQQLELDRQLTMLSDQGTPKFKYGSLQLYGAVDDSLFKLASELLTQIPARGREQSSGGSIDAKTFAARAMQELDYFREIFPGNSSKVIIREDITGLMVSKGNLLIGKNLKIPKNRIEALIQHELGTHVLTYLNGKAQPFRQLYVGLAGYDELQEGLAVFAEYLVGGLTGSRLRLLAARVIAAQHLVHGATFVEVFRIINKIHAFERKTAFNITMRTFRSGGLTKDAIYLRGLVQLLDYLKNGGALEPLFVGKIAVNHVAMIQELQWRKVLSPTPLHPSYLEDPQTAKKLQDVRDGLTIQKMVRRRSK